MPAIRTAALNAAADYTSPGGVAEIRLLLKYPAGELTHVVVPAGSVSLPAWVSPSSEWFFIVAGHGQLWDGSSDLVIDLVPGRCIRIPAGTPFQYRTDDEVLVFILAAMPAWRPEYHHVVPEGAWEATTPLLEPAGGIQTATNGHGPVTWIDLPEEASYLAPDGSQIRLLGSEMAGGLAHCLLPEAGVTTPVRHRTVEEIWFVLDGHGELSRRDGELATEVTPLSAGTCVDIATGVTFQFRTTGSESLRLLILTLPEWPGRAEAVPSHDLLTWGTPPAYE